MTTKLDQDDYSTMDDRHRYWEPHSSSIDFCETNYLHTDRIVEFHNTWSSAAGICTLGVMGILYNNPTNETRTTIAYAVVILVGLGSVGLHATLHWSFQASDELPMLYMNSVLHYMYLEYDAPLGQPHYPHLPLGLLVLSLVQTFLYYRFQHIYEVFIAMYGTGVFVLVVLFYKTGSNQKQNSKKNDISPTTTVSRKLGLLGLGSYLFLGLPVWILDMNCCDSILEMTTTTKTNNNNSTLTLAAWFVNGMTPHIIWHFAAALGTYCTIASVVAFRMESLNVPFRLEWWGVGGILPITVRTDAKDADDAVTKKTS